jgi:hypothetical protein
MALIHRMNKLIRNQHVSAVIVLLFILAFFYRDVVFNGRTFLIETGAPGTMPEAGPYGYHGVKPGFVANDAGAIAWQIEPFNRFVSTSLKRGDFPLWNPYTGLAGSPLLADGHTGPLEPLQFFFYFIPDQYWPYAVDIQLLLRFFLAGFFCYLFARRLKIGFLGGISGGILFMLSSYFVTFGNHPQIKTEALLPLALYGYDRLADFEDRQGSWFCALFIGWAIIAAMPESTFFVLFLGTLWYFYKSLIYSNWRKRTFAEVKNTLLRYAGSTTLGLMVSAVYLLPFLEFVSIAKTIHSSGTTGAVYETVYSSSYSLWMLSNLIFPDRNFFYLRLGFFSIFSLVFALQNLQNWPEHRQNILFFASYAMVFTLTVYDFPPTNWIRGLPVFNQLVFTKYPIPSIVFCLAILVAIFIDKAKLLPLSYRKISISLLTMLVVFIPLLIWGNPSTSLSTYFTDNGFVMISVAVFIAVSIVTVYILSHLYKSSVISIRVMQVGLLMIVAIEPFYWGMMMTRPERFDPFQAPPFVDYLKADKKTFRVFGLDGILYPNISTAYQLADIRWLDALVPQRSYDFSVGFVEPNEASSMRFTGTVMPVSGNMFDLLNVKYILNENSYHSKILNEMAAFRGYSLVYQDQDVGIYKNENVFPHAFVVHNIVNVLGFDKAINVLTDPNLNLRQTAAVENLPAELVNLINQNDNQIQSVAGEAKLISSGEMKVEVNTKAPGLLILTDQYYPGWQAFVDGKQATIYAVDGIFRGVFLEEGRHVIEFKYRPPSFIIGAMISLLSLLVNIIFLISQSRVLPNKYE